MLSFLRCVAFHWGVSKLSTAKSGVCVTSCRSRSARPQAAPWQVYYLWTKVTRVCKTALRFVPVHFWAKVSSLWVNILYSSNKGGAASHHVTQGLGRAPSWLKIIFVYHLKSLICQCHRPWNCVNTNIDSHVCFRTPMQPVYSCESMISWPQICHMPICHHLRRISWNILGGLEPLRYVSFE